MKILLTLFFAVLLNGCISIEEIASDFQISIEERISDFQTRCKLMGYEQNTESGKACVLELEKQYVMAVSGPCSRNDNTSVGSAASGMNKTPCMFNPQNDRYQACYHVTAGGTCAHFGSVCTP